MIKQSIAQLLETEMDRKDFLKTLAIAVVAMTGVTSIVKTLSNEAATHSAKSLSGRQQSHGYGVSRYSVATTASNSSSSYSS